MTVNRIIEDKELGPFVCPGQCPGTASHFPYKGGWIHVTVPPRTSLAEVENAIEQLRPRLRAAQTEAGQKAD